MAYYPPALFAFAMPLLRIKPWPVSVSPSKSMKSSSSSSGSETRSTTSNSISKVKHTANSWRGMVIKTDARFLAEIDIQFYVPERSSIKLAIFVLFPSLSVIFIVLA